MQRLIPRRLLTTTPLPRDTYIGAAQRARAALFCMIASFVMALPFLLTSAIMTRNVDAETAERYSRLAARTEDPVLAAVFIARGESSAEANLIRNDLAFVMIAIAGSLLFLGLTAGVAALRELSAARQLIRISTDLDDTAEAVSTLVQDLADLARETTLSAHQAEEKRSSAERALRTLETAAATSREGVEALVEFLEPDRRRASVVAYIGLAVGVVGTVATVITASWTDIL
jgi:hypothetical protein